MGNNIYGNNSTIRGSKSYKRVMSRKDILKHERLELIARLKDIHKRKLDNMSHTYRFFYHDVAYDVDYNSDKAFWYVMGHEDMGTFNTKEDARAYVEGLVRG